MAKQVSALERLKQKANPKVLGSFWSRVLRPLALLIALCQEECWVQVATTGWVLSLPGRNVMLVTFSTFVL